MDLKSLMQYSGLDISKKIKVARHKDEKRGYDLPLLYQIGQFDIYQSYQEGPDFHGCEYLISFLGTDNNQAIFIGVYKVKSIKKVSEVPLPDDFIYYDIYKPSRNYYVGYRKAGGFGLLLTFDDGRYAGVMGLGMNSLARKQIYSKPVIREEKDFACIEPVKCRVKYRNLTKAGLLRLPSFVEWI